MHNIEMFSSAWHVINSFFVFFIGVILILKFASLLNVNQKVVFSLYLYHTFFSVIYLFYLLSNGGDAIGYYLKGELPLPSFRPGTVAVVYISSLLHYLGFSILGYFFIFNIFGTIGLCFLYASLNRITKYSRVRLRKLTLLFLFLPSVSFWSSGLGKDAISFMSMGMALYAALNFNKRFTLMAIAVALMLFVRPHMAGIMVIAIVFSTTMSKNIPIIPRFIIGCIGLATALVMIPYALQYAGVESNASNLESYIETRQGYNQQGGGGVDIASMSLPMQMFTYMFRPMPFEVGSITQLLASLDNIFILYISFLALRARFSHRKLKHAGNRIFMWCYVIISWCILAMTTANLGIAVRQKWMFTPILVFLMISIIASVQQAKQQETYHG